MQFLEQEIQQYTKLICSTLFGLEVSPISGSYEGSSDETITGSVQISGEWNGAIILSLPLTLVNSFTEIMFSLEPGKASMDDKKDATGELINMVGGNIKALLPEPSLLSTPIIALEGNSLQFPSSKLRTHCQFECQGKNFGLSLYEQTK
ncbi:MAG: hypothetical protein HOH38_03290 [Nitrospinaceae bacterium]|jgi:chemotaxis protein CheX|nr:hypothetical protein [Nitrospina sp.]MBT5867844.1 hypothetical protein [Nitrospinaceae bacterium]MBT6345995.1 hypothetical protein [Nitrospina sp.]